VPVAQDSENSPNWITQARTRLALRRAEKPVTKAGQIRALWPEIEAALAVGQSTASICKWLEEDAGITLGVTSLTSYISRIRRREKANRYPETPAAQFVRAQAEVILPVPPTPSEFRNSVEGRPASRPPADPLAPAMRVLSRPKMDIRKIHNDGDPQGKNLI
jgi:hypothetical protein